MADADSSTATARSTASDRTRFQLVTGGVVALACTAFAGWALAAAALLSVTLAATWTGVTMAAALGLWSYTYVFSRENVAVEGNTRYATVGLPTGVTLLRGTVVAGLAGLALTGALVTLTDLWVWVAAVAYGVVAALDSVDGFLARRLRRTTRLGTRLDTAVDAFGLLVASLAGVVFGEIPAWYLSVGFARYVFVAGVWWRRRATRPTFDLPKRASRRVLAGVQMAVVPVALAPGVVDAWISPLVGIAASGVLVGFCRDWLYVTGRIETSASGRSAAPTRE